MGETGFINGIYLFCMGLFVILQIPGSATVPPDIICPDWGWYITAFPAKVTCY